MWSLTSLLRRLGRIGRQTQLERDLDDEVAFHLAMREERIRSGGGDDPRKEARLRFGNETRIREDVRATWNVAPFLGGLTRDIRYGIRSLLRSPAYATIAVLTLAVAIGLGTAMFSVLNAVLLRPLPYPDVDRLVMIFTERPAQGVLQARSAHANIEQWRQQARALEDVAFVDPASVMLTSAADPVRISVSRVSPNLFSMLGITLIEGRAFSWAEAEQQQSVAVVSQRFWREHLGGAAHVVGTTIGIDGRQVTVVGVAPEQAYLFGADVWEPFSHVPGWDALRVARGTGVWFAIGRTRPGVSIEQAESEATAIGATLEQAALAGPGSYAVSMTPVGRYLTGSRSRLALWMLSGAVLCVLLVAVTNVTSLVLTRSAGREREIAIRAALGAGRTEIIRQLLAEGLALALVAGFIGLALAIASFRFIVALTPASLAGLERIGVDLRVLGFSTAVCLLTTVVVGLAPAAVALRKGSALSAQSSGRGASAGARARRVRRTLIRVECALAVVLLIGAGLLLRSLDAAQNVDPGFRSERVLSLQLSGDSFKAPGTREALHARVLEEVAALPGVERTGLISDLVIRGDDAAVVTLDSSAAGVTVRTRFRLDEASADIFDTLQVPILHGRSFVFSDGPASPPVTIVNESMARQLWPNGEAVGRRFRFGAADSNAPWFTVIGVVADMRRQGFDEPIVPQMFAAIAQNPSRLVTLLVRTSSDDPLSMVASVRAAIRRADAQVPIYGIQTLDQRLGSFLTLRRFQTMLVAGFAAVALLLSAIGIYGLIHYTVATRSKEIAIRRAVGAQAGGIFRLIVGEGLALALTGLAIGLATALALGRIGSSLLFGVSATDPLTFAIASALLTTVTVVACYFPARKATKVNPVTALRQ